MNEILFYAGLVFAAMFFILAVVLLFSQNIPAVIRYFLKMRNRKIKYSTMNENRVVYKSSGGTGEDNSTQTLVESEKTELLDVAQNYATALLDADSTTLLPDLNDNEK